VTRKTEPPQAPTPGDPRLAIDVAAEQAARDADTQRPASREDSDEE
jgi:hypothetical protein